MGVQSGQFRKSREQSAIRENAVDRKAYLCFAAGSQRRSSLLKCPEPGKKRLHIRQQRLSCLGKLRLAAFQFKKRNLESLLKA